MAMPAVSGPPKSAENRRTLRPRAQTSEGNPTLRDNSSGGRPIADLGLSDVQPAAPSTDLLDVALEPLDVDLEPLDVDLEPVEIAPAPTPSERSVAERTSAEQLEINRRRRGVLTGPQAPVPDRIPSQSGSHTSRSMSVSGTHLRIDGSATQWKIRTEADVVYDFPDTPSLAGWLGSRTTLDDLSASSDGGKSFKPITEHAELTDIKAQGYRTSATRAPAPSGSASGLLPLLHSGSTGSIPTARLASSSGAGEPLQEAEDATNTEPAPRAKRKRTKKQKKARKPLFSRAAKKSSKKRAKSRRPKKTGSRNSRIGALLFLLILVSALALAYYKLTGPPTIPNTPAGKQLRWALGAMNGHYAVNESDVIEHFAPSALETVPPHVIADHLYYWYERNPGYLYDGKLHGATRTRLEGLLLTIYQDQGIITVAVEENPPHRITELYIRPAPHPDRVPDFDMDF